MTPDYQRAATMAAETLIQYGINSAPVSALPAVHVSPELNRAVRDQFMPYIMNYFDFQRYAAHNDSSALADLGYFMDGYEE